MAAVRRKPVGQSASVRGSVSSSSSLSTNVPVVTAVCCHCRASIFFQTWRFFCEYCNLSVCSSCHAAGKHPYSHAEFVFGIVSQKRTIDFQGSSEACSRCNKPFWAGFACNECSEKICWMCSDNEEHLLYSHSEHRWFVEWLAPYSGVSSTTMIQCDGKACHHDTSMRSHCAMCYKITDFSTAAGYTCSTCPAQYCRFFCSECYPHAAALDVPNHKWISIEMDQIPHNEIETIASQRFSCKICGTKWPSWFHESFQKHPHNDYQYKVDDRFIQYSQHFEHRACFLKQVRHDVPCQGESHIAACTWCRNEFKIEELDRCQACLDDDELLLLCSTCFPYCSTHWHDRGDFLSIRSSVRLPSEVHSKDLSIVRLPDVIPFTQNSTGRKWYASQSNLLLSSFTEPMPLPQGWTWWRTSASEYFFVSYSEQISMRTSPLDIHPAAWTNPGNASPDWHMVGLNEYRRKTDNDAIVSSILPSIYGTRSIGYPLPEEWVLEITGSEHHGPWFRTVHAERYAQVARHLGPTCEDPRISCVQWMPFDLPSHWQTQTGQDGRIHLWDPQRNIYVPVPPEPVELKRQQTITGQPLDPLSGIRTEINIRGKCPRNLEQRPPASMQVQPPSPVHAPQTVPMYQEHQSPPLPQQQRQQFSPSQQQFPLPQPKQASPQQHQSPPSLHAQPQSHQSQYQQSPPLQPQQSPPLLHTQRSVPLRPRNLIRPASMTKSVTNMTTGVKNWTKKQNPRELAMLGVKVGILGLKAVHVGVSIGAALTGNNVNIPNYNFSSGLSDIGIGGSGGGGGGDGFQAAADIAQMGSANTFASAGSVATDGIQG